MDESSIYRSILCKNLKTKEPFEQNVSFYITNWRELVEVILYDSYNLIAAERMQRNVLSEMHATIQNATVTYRSMRSTSVRNV